MSHNLHRQLKELGSKLENPPPLKDSLIKLLKQAGTCLSELDQSPTKSTLESMEQLLNAIVKPELLKHLDREVKLLVATCVCEITRITAPEAPYSDEVLKDIFQLIVGTFSGLSDTSGPSFGRRVVILETVARYRSCVVMLDLECDDLVTQMFRTFFSVASDIHPESVLTSMQTIMVVLLEESEEIQEDLLVVLLSVLGRQKSDFSTAARKLAMNVIECCAGKLEPGIKQWLMSSMTGDGKSFDTEIDYHELIYGIYQCAPQILSGVVPYLTGELLTDRLDIRLKAVKLVGDLFSLPGSAISEMFQPIFSEFLKRLTDRVLEVRMAVLERAKICLLSNPSRSEAPQIFSALCDRLLDYDENIRKEVVAAVCDVASHALTSVPVETVKLVAERLRDKSLLVKKYTMRRLAEIYKQFCINYSNDLTGTDDFDWIPGKILRCFYDKDFRFDLTEPILCGSLSPAEFSVKEQVKSWIRVFPRLDKVEVKALEKLLEQKQRLRQEMVRYLCLRQMHQESNAIGVQKKLMFCFRIMARCFTDPVNAEECFQILDQLKDANVWKILAALLDPSTSFFQACNYCDDMLKILGEKHRLYDFLRMLSLKCSYVLFNKDHVKEILMEAASLKSGGNLQVTVACMDILVILACYSPLLLTGIEKDLVHLLEEDNEVIKEGVLHVLAKAGGTIREQLGVSSSSLDLTLERICLEGSRRQAKYAVHALAAITKDDGLMSLSVLYKRLVDMLEERTNLPAVLQSLGCIAQSAMSIFETRESEIEEFIKKNILKSSNKPEGQNKESWDDRTELCSLKIFGIKTLVKSYLPAKDANLRVGIDGLLEILKNILFFGEISRDILSSPVDKAHLRLAAAKAVLRLSRHWDHRIPIDLFYLTLRTSEVGFPQAKKHFLNKVHQYVKDRLLDPKYALAFLFDVNGCQKSDFEEAKQNLSDIIQTCQQGKIRQLSAQSDANLAVVYPEFILPYVVHALAHLPSCPNVDECRDIMAFEPSYRKLQLFLSMLLNGDEDANAEVSSNNKKETISTVHSIFHSIKCSEDAADPTKSKNSHAMCDLGLSITKRLAQKEDDLQGKIMSVSLPPMLYKPREAKEGDDPVVNEIHACLADESVLSQFESLKLEVNGKIHPDVGDEIMNNSETDGNEIPLGKIMKRLRAKGPKAKKGMKSPTLLAGTKNEDDVDILKMVREIDLDTLGASSKFESSNGHQDDTYNIRREPKIAEKKKRVGSATCPPVPKRRRSLSQGSYKLFRPINDDSEDKVSLQENFVEPAELNLLATGSQNNSDSSKHERKNSGKDHTVEVHKDGEVEQFDMKPVKVVERDHLKEINSPKSSNGPYNKRKRKSVAGLTKCTPKEVGTETMDLIDCRIKVWWPMDKEFYAGAVKSYDPQKRKHVVLYDDGDVEVLNLNKERWELLDSSWKVTKPSKLSKGKSHKLLSSKHKDKSLSSSHQSKQSLNISPSSKARGKRTPRKKGTSKRENFSKLMKVDSGESSGMSDTKTGQISKGYGMKSDASNGKPDDTTEKSLTGKEEPGMEQKSASEGTSDEGDSDNAPSDVAEPEQEETNPEGKSSKPFADSPSDTLGSSDEGGSYLEEKQLPDVSKEGSVAGAAEPLDSGGTEAAADGPPPETQPKKSGGSRRMLPPNSAKADNSDDETLGVWRHRMGKSAKAKLG